MLLTEQGSETSEAQPNARIVRVHYREGQHGLVYAMSPDIRGLAVSPDTMAKLSDAMPVAIADLLAARGEMVTVSEVPIDDRPPSRESAFAALLAGLA